MLRYLSLETLFYLLENNSKSGIKYIYIYINKIL